jgi:hypothetical protein
MQYSGLTKRGGLWLPSYGAYKRTQVVTSGTYADGAGMFDLTTANAFTGCAGLSSYQDGKHLLWASDGTNTLVARISATAPGGEDVGDVIATGTLTALTLYKIVITTPDHFGVGLEAGDYFVSDGTEECDIFDTVRQVTGPATTGALLLGSTGARGYISKSASFNANAAGSYRIYTTKKYRSV